MGERLRDGIFALRLPPAARRRDHFVSHAYIVPHATDKTSPYGAGWNHGPFEMTMLILAFFGQSPPGWARSVRRRRAAPARCAPPGSRIRIGLREHAQ
jgi:hypothetical protein